MLVNAQKYEQAERVRRSIGQMLENLELLRDEAWADTPETYGRLEELSCGREEFACTSADLGITQAEDGHQLVFAACRKDFGRFVELVREQAARVMEETEASVIHLALFVSGMRHRIRVERQFDRKACQALRAELNRAARGGRKIRALACTCVLLGTYEKQTVSLRDLEPYQMILEPPPRLDAGWRRSPEEAAASAAPPVQAAAATSALYQLAELYNLVGEPLFQTNVRFGIDEVMGVDQSICQTLEKEPELFWFRNNGITILTESASGPLRRGEELILGRLEPGEPPDFSVVNGAQTITAAARYFYRLEDRLAAGEGDEEFRKKLRNQLERAREQARVLVRVIRIRGGRAEALSKSISVALNRQKPIRMEDIAFTSAEVSKLALFLSSAPPEEKNTFRLIRRGEDAGGDRFMELETFVRARLACAGHPGAARAKSTNELLRLSREDTGVQRLVQPGIFSDDWLDAEDGREGAVFRRDYGAVWFAGQAAAEYDRLRRGIRYLPPEALAVIQNGKWYFTAVLAALLNGFSTDFSAFSADFRQAAEKLPAAMRQFIDLMLLCPRDPPDAELNSNYFKNDRPSQWLLHVFQGEAGTDDPDQAREIRRQAEAFAALFGVTLPPCRDSGPAGGTDGSWILLGQKRASVSSDAQALTQITEYLLNTYTVSGEELALFCGSWLTASPVVSRSGEGYFRGAPRQIQAGANLYWVGTSSNTKAKQRQLRALWRLTPAGENEIRWIKNGQQVFPF